MYIVCINCLCKRGWTKIAILLHSIVITNINKVKNIVVLYVHKVKDFLNLYDQYIVGLNTFEKGINNGGFKKRIKLIYDTLNGHRLHNCLICIH